jgi:hypothetical protein
MIIVMLKTSNDIAHLEVYVGNLFGRLQGLNPRDSEQRLSEFVDGVLGMLEPKVYDPALVVANIRPRSYIPESDIEKASIIAEPLAGDVVVFYQILRGGGISSLNWDDISGTDFSTLKQTALKNIARRMQKAKIAKSGNAVMLFFVDGEEMLTPGLLLTSEFQTRVAELFPKGALILIPRLDDVVVVDKTVPDAVKLARKMIDKAFETNHDLLSEFIYEFRDGKIEVVSE